MQYKVKQIVYSTDGVKVDLPTEMIVDCENEDGIADAISDKTGWLVESFNLEKQSELLVEQLLQIKEKAKSAIVEILTKRKVVSINVHPYLREQYVTNYAFFDTNNNGDGECLELNAIIIGKNGNPDFDMYTSYGSWWGVRHFIDFDASELVYILEMIEEIFELVDEGKPLLKEDEDFDEYE